MTRQERIYAPRKTPFHERVLVIPLWFIAVLILIAMVCASKGYEAHQQSVIVKSESLG